MIFNILRKSKLSDQFPPSKSRSYARRIADKINLTLSVLEMTKKLLFCGFFHDNNSIDSLLQVLVPLIGYGIKEEEQKEDGGILSGVGLGLEAAGGRLSGVASSTGASVAGILKKTDNNVNNGNHKNGGKGGKDSVVGIEMSKVSE